MSLPQTPDSGTPLTPEVLSETLRQLQASESHLQGLLGSAPDSILGMDTEGFVTDWNPGAERVLGWTRDEALGRRMSELVIPHRFREAHENGMRRFLKTGHAQVLNRIIEIAALHKDGHEFPIELSIWSINNERGQGFGASIRDVTERHKAQESLRNSEERYRSVVEHLGEGMFVAQYNRIVFANQQASQILRVPNEEIIGSDPVEWIHPDDQADVLELRQRLASGQEIARHYEARHIGHDGVVRWLNIRPTPVAWEGGMATLTFFSEITESKQIAEALQRSEERYRAVIEHSGEGMLVVQDGRFVFANHRAAELVQMTREDMLREGYLHRIHPDDRAMVDDRRQRRLAGEEVPNRYEIRLLLPDNVVRWIDIGVTVVPWDGAPGTLTFFSDITERKQAEVDLQRTSSEREAILHSALVGIVLSVDRKHQWVNDKYAEMVGYTREELLGQSTALVHTDLEAWARWGEEQRVALQATGSFSNERQLKRRNGEVFWVQMAGSRVRAADPDSGVIWTLLDITERIKAEQSTRFALEQQKELNELRSRFVAMTSHEFRTPLATILSSAELLKYYGDRMPAADKIDVIQTIENGVQRMTRMLDRVLLLGKAEAQMLEFKPTLLDLVALGHTLVEDAKTQHPDCRCTLVTDFEVQPATGLYDEKLLGHIFGNLLSNAMKYSPQGGEVRFSMWREADQVVMQVSDQGIGIPTEEIPHLFESFHRASNVGEIQGTGLGLAIVKNSVDLHGGSIHVASAAGQGTSFTVRLAYASGTEGATA
ncbi:PAS domain S-box protein [Rhodoferax saidenbachensis]|uniref:histidine kinase n=1 Tax=Rhodoferax saidenbachensis TaxID=1484693 RepID=A0ABU1ZLC3_9BURK|nr:PAS domain S-box protein [Rhodoferax saidenbachensis]MDR7306342.1 PAS domain S-box-containing protein [Rhodoferax saidenbachensis]